jgi:alpha-galactosidase
MPKRLLLATLLTLSPLLHAQAATTLNGFWEFRDPHAGVAFFHLTQTGDTITGSEEDHKVPVTGTLKGSTLHLTYSTKFYEENHIRIFDGTRLPDGTFALTGTGPGFNPGEIRHVTGNLHPVDRAVVYPPILPLPPVQNLPDNGLARTPPMGWNSWNHFSDQIDDKTVRQMADLLVSTGMARAGYNYVVVDGGWSSYRDKNGNITGTGRFPNMKALADYVHSKGLKIGIYSGPGPQTCSGYTGSYGHEVEDARTFAAWGYDYLKYDWCSANRIYPHDVEHLRGTTQKMAQALAATGRPIVFSLCEYGWGDVQTWAADAGANLWRTTGDITDNWKAMDKIGFNQFALAPYAKPGHWNDPDMLEVGNGGMSADEYRYHITLWALLRAPLMAGNDLRTMTPETLAILTNPEVIAIDQDPTAQPVQRQPPQGKGEILVRPLAHGTAIALFNRGETPTRITYDLGKATQAHDVWTHLPLPTDRPYTYTLEPHSVILIYSGGPTAITK